MFEFSNCPSEISSACAEKGNKKETKKKQKGNRQIFLTSFPEPPVAVATVWSGE